MADVIESVETRGFRNLEDALIRLPPGVGLFHGPNGAGKTNVLEAVYFGLTGVSFRPGNDRDAIRFEERTARAEVVIAGERRTTVLASVDRGGDRRHLLDGSSSLDRRPLVSVFLPDRLALVKGPPAQRRAHIDRFASVLWPARAELRCRFGRVLAQRNALVSRIRSGLASTSALETWDTRLADEAVPLIEARAEAAEALAGPFSAFATELGLPEAELRYRPRFEGTAQKLLDQLKELRDADLGRAYTGFGPQLDEIELRQGGRAVRRFASQGQQRIALLALLLAERRVLGAAERPVPLMLLDDVMSELDPHRRSLLIETLQTGGQALITATEPEQVPGLGPPARVAIEQGRARPALAEAA